MAGTKEWAAKWDLNYQWIDCSWETAEAIAKYKEDIYLGKKKFGRYEMYKLQAWLGITEYNKFVEAYNN